MVHEHVAAVAGPSDAELIRASDDDGDAFGRLYDRHATYVLPRCIVSERRR